MQGVGFTFLALASLWGRPRLAQRGHKATFGLAAAERYNKSCLGE